MYGQRASGVGRSGKIRSVRLLVLGNSDTQGRFVDGPTWSAVLRDTLRSDLDEAVELTETGFSAISAGAASFAERKVRELEPDVVVLPLGTFAFTVGFTWKRLERLFGRRIAQRYRRAEEAFDRRTREDGHEPRRVNRLARTAIRSALGTEPLISQATLRRNYADILRAIARIENVDVVLVAYPPEQGRHVTVRNVARRREEFLRDLTAEARSRHYGVVDTAPLFSSAPAGDALLTADGFHLQRHGHELVGAAVARFIATKKNTAASL